MLVWCLIIDHNKTVLGCPFPVTCADDSSISALIKFLVESKAILTGTNFIHVGAYHSATFRGDLSSKQLQAALYELDLDTASVSPMQLVFKVFSGREGEVVIFQKPALPSRVSSKRRLESPVEDEYERLKRTKLAREAPSRTAALFHHHEIQDDIDERIFDDRPEPDPRIAAMELLYPYFGEFQDIYAGQPLPSDMQPQIDSRKVEEWVMAFAVAMSCKYGEEYIRRDTGNKYLNKIFPFPLWAGPIEKANTDDHTLVAGVVSTIVEYKNELVGISCYPGALCCGHVAKSHTYRNALHAKCNFWRIPALGIVIIGDWIQFNAIILLGHQYRSVGLTSPISCALAATNDFERRQLLKAFTAAHILQQRIHEDLKSYIQESIPRREPFVSNEFFFPAVTTIRENGYDAANKNYIKFKIFDYEGGSDEKLFRLRHLYRARVTQPDHSHSGKDIVVKFSQKYAIDLHKLCHNEHHAPKVLGFELLPGGWYAIAMEYLANVQSIDSGLAPDRCNELEDLVKRFHEQGLVHGDLRSPNILYNSDNFWLIDFDWGGEAGKVQYPTWLLHEDLLGGRQAKDLTICKEDDLRVLHATLATLKSSPMVQHTL